MTCLIDRCGWALAPSKNSFDDTSQEKIVYGKFKFKNVVQFNQEQKSIKL